VQAIVDSVDLTQDPPQRSIMDRTTHSTRSSGLSGRRHDRERQGIGLPTFIFITGRYALTAGEPKSLSHCDL